MRGKNVKQAFMLTTLTPNDLVRLDHSARSSPSSTAS